MKYATSSRISEPLVNMDQLVNNLANVQYGKSPSSETIIKSMDSSMTYNSVTLETHPLENLACALPKAADASMSDISLKEPNDLDTIVSACSLGLSVAGKMFRKVGDVNLNYCKSNGNVTNWSITIKGLDYQDRVIERTLPKDDAIKMLKENKHNGDYNENKELKKLLDNF